MNDFHDQSACPPAALPADPTDIKAMLTVLVERNAAPCALHHVCTLPRRITYLRPLAGHPQRGGRARVWFSEFLGRAFGSYLRQGDLALRLPSSFARRGCGDCAIVREFTPAELARLDGAMVRPLRRLRGPRLDVTASLHCGGRHQFRHQAGADLTASLARRHTEQTLLTAALVGRLAGSTAT